MKVPLPGTAKRSNHLRTNKVSFIDLDPAVRPHHISKPWVHPSLHKKWSGALAPIATDFIGSNMWGAAGELYFASPLVSKRNGMLTYDQLDTEQGTTDINALPRILANKEFRDGPRGVCAPSPFSTYIGYPSPVNPAQATPYPIWIGVYLMGNLHTLDSDGALRTIVGRRPKAGVYTDLDNPESCMEWVGDFDIHFNTPTDIWRDQTSLDPASPVYVADYGNNRIAIVRGQTVRTLVTLPKPTSIDSHDGSVLYVSAADGLYTVNTTTLNVQKLSPFNPFCIRLNAAGTGIAGVYQTGSVVTIDLATLAQTIIGTTANSQFVWLSLDRFGTVGPVDDFIALASTGGTTNTELTRFSFDGTRKQRAFSDKPGSMTPGFGYSRMSMGPAHFLKDITHYPWIVGIHPTEGHIITGGTGDGTVTEYRFVTPDDTDLFIDHEKIKLAWPMLAKGSVQGFPPCRHSLTTHVDIFGKTFFDCHDFEDLAAMSDADLIAFIQNGFSGKVPRPDFTGQDLIGLMYYIRKQSSQYTGKPVLLPLLPKQVAPVVSNITWTRSADSITVQFNTDITAIGYVAFGPTTDVHRFTDIEPGFSTTHSFTLRYPDDVKLFSVRVRNSYGAQTWMNFVDCSGSGGTAAPATIMPTEYYNYFEEPVTLAVPYVKAGVIGAKLTAKDGQDKPADPALKWVLLVDNVIVGGVNAATDTIPVPALSTGPHALSLEIINGTVLSPQLLRPTPMEYQAGVSATPTPTPAPTPSPTPSPTPAPVPAPTPAPTPTPTPTPTPAPPPPPTVEQQLADALAQIATLNATVTQLQTDKASLAGKIALMLQHIQEAQAAAS